MEEENVHDIVLEFDEKILIFGDIHGQFPDFIKVIEKEGLPSNKLKYVRFPIDLHISYNFSSYSTVILLIAVLIQWNV